MPTLWAASFRHLVRHPAQLLLALVGLSLGVATIIAVDIATASSRRAFELSMDAVNGAATHQIIGGPQGIDERVYVDLRTHESLPGVVQPALAPVVEGYVLIGDRDMQVVGVDPFASPELGAAALRLGMGKSGSRDAGNRRSRIETLQKWFTELEPGGCAAPWTPASRGTRSRETVCHGAGRRSRERAPRTWCARRRPTAEPLRTPCRRSAYCCVHTA